MKLIEASKLINSIEAAAFTTNDIATSFNLTKSNASQILGRLSKSGHLIRLKRGLWAKPNIDPFLLPNFLVAPLPAYISFHTALYYRDVVDQVPSVIYVATLGKTTKFKTPIATISAHQIQPSLFFGYTYDEKTGIKMATSEKALFDVLYLSPAKSGIFKSLPELDMKEIDLKALKKMIEKILSKSRKKIVLERFEKLKKSL